MRDSDNYKYSYVPKVFGILSTSFGFLIGIFSSINLRGSGNVGHPSVTGDELAKKLMAAVEDYMQAYQPIYIVFMVFSIALIIIGFGQLRYRKWVEYWSKMWSKAAILTLVIMCVYLFLYVRGPYAELMQLQLAVMTKSTVPAVAETGQAVIGTGLLLLLIHIILFAPYPIVMYIFFKKEKTIKSLIY